MATMSSPDSDDPLGIGRKLGFHRSSNNYNASHHSYFQQQLQQQQQQQHQSRCPHIVVSDASLANGAVGGGGSGGGGSTLALRTSVNGKTHHHHHHSHHQHHHTHQNGQPTNNDLLMAKVKMKAAVDPLAHKHVEENIETFLESFKHKTWSVDTTGSPGQVGRDGGVMTLLDTRRTSCSDSGDYDPDDADDNSSTTTNTTDSHCWTSSVISTADDISTDSPGDGPTFLSSGGAGSANLSTSGATGGAAIGGGGAGAGGGVAGSKKHPSTLEYSTSGSARGVSWRDSDSIIAESRRIARWAWRQSNFTGSQDTPCSCSYHPPHPLVYDVESEYVIIESAHEEPPGSAMDEASQQYKVIDVAPLLQTRYAILSGGKAKNGAPIMTFPARPGQTDVSDEDYGRVVTYLCGITPLHESESGFVVVIDRRQDGWSLVKSILLKLSAFFPVHIQVVFLLQPKGFFQRAFADLRSKFVKDELEFKVILCDSPKDIEEWIDMGQLTSDVGGELEFDASEWTEHRSAVEKFSKNTAQISTNLSGVVKKMEERELPNDMAGTQTLMRMCQGERKELLEDIDSASAHGDTLLKCIRGDCERTPLTKLCHVLELERLLVQLDESRTGFGEFWVRHETKLQQCLILREFEEEFKLIQFTMGRRQEVLEGAMEELGESVIQVEQLLKEFEALEEESQNDIDKTDRMRTRGRQLMMDEHYAVDSIRPKCVELQRMCEQYKELLRKRREMLTKSHDLQDRLDRANKWCSAGVDMLANQPTDRLQSPKGAQQAMDDIETYLASSKNLKLSNPREFRQLFESMMTADTRANVQHILKRMEDVQGMCAKRKESLRSVLGPSKTRPSQQQVRADPPPPADPSVGQPAGSDLKKPVIQPSKSARFRPDIQHQSMSSDAADSSFNLSQASSRSASDTSSSVTSDTQRSSVSSVSMSSFPEGDSPKSKQRLIMNELIETEEAYVNELHQIIQGYYNKLDDKSLLMMVPPAVLGQKHILFGNLEDIYHFHKDVFLNELKECRDFPSKVGNIFVNRKEEFQMYSIYCQNKPKSEALRIRVGDSNAFFKECQRQLGHRLPLGAYLLKPIQRITKYQLLLKEMLKNSGDNVDLTAALNEAFDTMLSVLAYLNDSMHQVAISGYTGNLSDLGRLLLHGSFRVWTEHKNEKLKGLRLRPMQRHMFLYQRDMLFCKQREGDENQPAYTFKTKINLSQVGLTEKLKGDKRKFELWLRGREEVYIIQAPDMATKDLWIKEIKRVLLSQFDHLKANKQLHVGTANPLQILTDSDLSLDNWRSSGDESDLSRGNNNNSKSSSLTRNTPAISPPYHQGSEVERAGLGGAGDQEDNGDDDGGWSSGEFSNTDDEQLDDQHLPKLEPSYCEHFVSLGDYYPIDSTELGLTEGDEVEVQRVGTNGWWYARHMTTGGQGWVPATYLEPVSRQGQGHGVSSSNSEGNLFSSSEYVGVEI